MFALRSLIWATLTTGNAWTQGSVNHKVGRVAMFLNVYHQVLMSVQVRGRSENQSGSVQQPYLSLSFTPICGSVYLCLSFPSCLCFCLPVSVDPLLFVSPSPVMIFFLRLYHFPPLSFLTVVSTNHSCLTKNTFRKPKLLDLVGKLKKETTKNSQYPCKNYTPFWSGGFSFWKGEVPFSPQAQEC